MICPDCKKDWPEDRFNGKHPECFRCRTQGVGVTFGGGRENFHGLEGRTETLREYQGRVVSEAAKNGIEAVPVGKGTNYSGGSGSMDRLAKALAPKPKVDA